MPVTNARHHTRKLRRCSVPLVLPHPQAAVAIPTHLLIRGIASGFVHLIQVIIDHRQERLAVGRFVSGPVIIGMIIRRNVDTLLSSYRYNE